MKPQQLLRRVGVVTLGMIGGAGLGYLQDDLTQGIASIVRPFGTALFAGAALGWIVSFIWYGLTLRFAALRVVGLRTSLDGMFFLLSWWLATIAGGVAFFLVNGMDYMTIGSVVFYAAWAGTAYNFVLVVLPLLALSVDWTKSAGTGGQPRQARG